MDPFTLSLACIFLFNIVANVNARGRGNRESVRFSSVCLSRKREGGREVRRERVKVILILFIVGELLLNIYFN